MGALPLLSFLRFLGCALFFSLSLPSLAAASLADQLTFIQDTEVQTTLKAYADPVFRAASLSSSSIRLHVAHSSSLNAFVTEGQHLILFSELILSTPSPDALVGVIAHETGHILGGHLVRLQQRLHHSSTQSLLATLLGGVAGLATSQPGLALAFAFAGQDVALKELLRHTRAEESAADQSALNLLDSLRLPSNGLAAFLKTLHSRENYSFSSLSPYLLTHPLTEDRLDFIERHAQRSPYTSFSPSLSQAQHDRLLAKIRAFLKPPAHTLKFYADQTSVAARYARSIAYFRDSQLDLALEELRTLLNDFPQDPFFHELRGQILFESGRLDDALTSYRTALQLLPRAPLILQDLAHVELEISPPLVDSAITHLKKALIYERDLPRAWKLLAVAYGHQDHTGLVAYALAEYFYLLNDLPTALDQIARAEHFLLANAPERRQISDLKALIEKK